MFVTGKRRAVESFVVAKRGQTQYIADSTISTATGNVVLADGQLGVFSESGTRRGRSLTTAQATLANAQSISVYQGTENSANVAMAMSAAPLWVRPFEKTAIVDSKNSVMAYKQPYKKGSFSVWGVTGVTPIPSTIFALHIAFRGRSIQNYFGAQEALSFSPQFTTSSYDSTVAANVTTARNQIINYLVYDTLRNSAAVSASERNRGGSFPLMGFAIDTTAVTAGTVINAIVAGTPFAVLSTATAGNRTVTFNQDQLDSFLVAATAAGIPLTSTIVPASITTPLLVNAMMFMAMDRIPALKDYEYLDKISLEVGLLYGFSLSTTTVTNGSTAREPQGLGKQLALQYKFTQGQRKYNLITVEDPIVEFPNPFDVTETYDIIELVHADSHMMDWSHNNVSPFRSIIAVPTAAKGVEGVAAQYTSLETTLNAWLTATGNQVIVD